MGRLWLSALLIGLLPTISLADHRPRDRDDRWHDRSSHSRSYWSFSFGFRSSDWCGDFSSVRFSYGSHRPIYHPPRVYYYYTPAPCPPPVIVYPVPSYHYYYYTPAPAPYYYWETRYYYGR